MSLRRANCKHDISTGGLGPRMWRAALDSLARSIYPSEASKNRTLWIQIVQRLHKAARRLSMQRKASAAWQGDLKTGKGSISTESGTLKQTQYSFSTRFENGVGTNPEELIAAAHAGCFSMAFSAELGKAGFTPTSINTTATVTLDKTDAGFTVTESHLEMTAKIP